MTDVESGKNTDVEDFYRSVAGAVIAKARRSRGLTLDDLSEKTGVHRTCISRIENGYQNLDIQMLRTFARGLDYNPQTLSDECYDAIANAEKHGIDRAIEKYQPQPVDPRRDELPFAGFVSIPVTAHTDSEKGFSLFSPAENVVTIDVASIFACKSFQPHSLVFSGDKLLYIQKWPADGQLCICSIRGAIHFKRYHEYTVKSKEGMEIVILLSGPSFAPDERPISISKDEIDWCHTVVGTWMSGE